MPELIRLTPRDRDAPPDAVARVRERTILERALADARSLLPWHGFGTPARERLAAHGLVAALWTTAARVLGPAVLGPALGALGPEARLAVFFALTAAVVTLVPALLAFGGSLAFGWLRGRDAEGRLGQALICPYCRDGVDREGTVICGRVKCGALYHRECWDECARAYGGCAVYGCSSRKCREVSAAGWALRIGKLVVAAALFPPRAVRALRRSETETASSVYHRAREKSRAVYRWTNERSSRQLVFVGIGVLLSYVAALPIVLHFPVHSRKGILLALVPIFGIPFLMLVVPYVVALPFVFLLTFGRALRRILEAEFAALERADQGGGTVLGRLAAGFGAKKALS